MPNAVLGREHFSQIIPIDRIPERRAISKNIQVRVRQIELSQC